MVAATIDRTKDHEAELWVLQSMVLDSNAADYVIANATELDFEDERNRIIYRQLAKVMESGRKFDATLFVRSLNDSKTGIKTDFEAIGGMPYLVKVIDEGVTFSHVNHYLKKVKKATAQRNLKGAAERILETLVQADPEESIDEIASRCEQFVFEATDKSLKRETLVSAKAATLDALERLDFRLKHGAGEGLQTGFDELDKMTGGLRSGEMVVIAARPGCGKSALATNIAEAISAEGMVLFVSLEMSSMEIADRMLASMARVPLFKMRNGSLSDGDRRKVVETSGKLSRANLYFEDSPTRSVAQIASTARLVKRKHGLKCIIVDYLQLVAADNGKDPRQEQVAKISRKFKAMAREMKVPVICLAQLNRQADDPTKPPKLSQLRESGAIEQDADVVIFIHRPGTVVKGDSEEAELHVAKQRNGPTGMAQVHWFRHWCRFDNAAADWQERREPAFEAYNAGESF